jgi:hypothetical protein
VNLLYPTIAALVILTVFTFVIGRQNRDLLRVRAYRDFFLRMIPSLSTAVFVAGLPIVMAQATFYNYGPVLLVYLAGATTLTVVMSRAVIPDERRAGMAFRKGEYEKAAGLYEELVSPATTRRWQRASTPLAAPRAPSKPPTGPSNWIPNWASPTTTGPPPSPLSANTPGRAATSRRSSRRTPDEVCVEPPRRRWRAWRSASAYITFSWTFSSAAFTSILPSRTLVS